MTSLDSTRKVSVSEISSLASQFGLSSASFKVAGANFNIGELLSGASSIEAISSGNTQQQQAGVQSLIGHVVSTVSKILNAQADAEQKVKENDEKVKDADKKVEKTEEDLSTEIVKATDAIDTETEIVKNAQATLEEKQEELKELQQLIEDIKSQIAEKQEQLNNQELTSDEKRALLDEIYNLGYTIVDYTEVAESINKEVLTAEEEVVKSTAAIEAIQGRTVEVQNKAQSDIAEAGADTTKATGDIVKTQAEGAKDVAEGEAILASSAATGATGVLAPVSAVTAKKGKDLIAAGTKKITGSVGSLADLKNVILGSASNKSLASLFEKTTSASISAFNGAVGSWGEGITPFIESIGSYTPGGDLESQAWELIECTMNDTEALGGQSVAILNSEIESNENEVDKQQSENPIVELKTPKFKFGV